MQTFVGLTSWSLRPVESIAHQSLSRKETANNDLVSCVIFPYFRQAVVAVQVVVGTTANFRHMKSTNTKAEDT